MTCKDCKRWQAPAYLDRDVEKACATCHMPVRGRDIFTYSDYECIDFEAWEGEPRGVGIATLWFGLFPWLTEAAYVHDLNADDDMLMRNGKILAEGKPWRLAALYGIVWPAISAWSLYRKFRPEKGNEPPNFACP